MEKIDYQKQSLVEQVKQRVAKRDEKLKQNPLYTKKYSLEYITAVSAFNIPYKGDQCDWHQVDMLRYNKYQTHPINYIGAEDIFGNYGLWDCTEFFLSRGIEKNSLCATPIRAILDKLFHSLAIYDTYPIEFDNFNDYMFDAIDMDELREKLKILKARLKPHQQEWLSEWETKNEIY